MIVFFNLFYLYIDSGHAATKDCCWVFEFFFRAYRLWKRMEASLVCYGRVMIELVCVVNHFGLFSGPAGSEHV
jgi:hypothetical protein